MEGEHGRVHFLVQSLITIILALCLLLSLYFFYKNQLMPGIAVLIVPFVIAYVVWVFMNPNIGFLSMFIANYFVLGIARYLPGPLGLSVDALLVLTWLSLFFTQFNKKVEWKKAANSLTVVSVIWFLYILFELFNPEARSQTAWFYAMRGVGLYMILTVPLTFILLDNKKYLDLMLKLWAIFTLLGVVKGLMQLYIGPDPWESYWLATVGGKTHLIATGLRVFSFFSDAATYGCSMGYSGVVFLLVALHTPGRKSKLFYLITGLAAMYGMLISGTRGAIAVPFAGFTLYAILSKRVKVLIGGGILIVTVYVILKFTTIGAGNAQIRRFRTALDSDNPSLMVRKENQKLLKVYLSSRPFGGGIGSAGNWGLRFSPGTFLAETPTDSWYVQIWAEQGIVGLTLHLMVLAFQIGSVSYIILFRLKTNELAGKATALISGIFGIMAASYGSGALGQMPNGIIIYMSLAFIFMMPKWERELSDAGKVPAPDATEEDLAKALQ
jgi:hypothetical protein